jgi:hypothetical protein
MLVNGSGLDLWCNKDGTLAEEHYWLKNGERGYKRLWSGEDRTVCEEEVWGPGKGSIRRDWNARGKLRRGFPRFYVAGRRVMKWQYLRACQADRTLPPYRSEDDAPLRSLPPEDLVQREKRSS